MSNTAGTELNGKSESDLIALACEGDADAFGLLYEKYIDQIYNYIYFRTSNGKDAEDITSRVFLRALNHIEKYEDRGYPFSAWLYRIAHNLVVNWYRDSDRSDEISLLDQYPPPPTEDGSIEERIEDEDEKEYLIRIINSLPEDRRELLILKHVEGLTNSEIGQIMDRTEGAIKALYHRTLETLRDDYGV